MRVAGDAGLLEAQKLLAGRYAEGEGVEQSLEEARRWYELAAQQGTDRGARDDRDRVRYVSWSREVSPLNL